MGKLKSILAKVNNLPASAKASFWFVVSNVALKGISFITTPIFTRLLNVEDYGTTSVFVTWESIICVFATLHLASGVYNVAMTKFADDIDRYTTSMFWLTSLLSTVVYGLVLGFNTLFPQVFELSNVYLAFMWLQSLCNAFVSFWLLQKRFHYKYKPIIAYSAASAILGPTIAIVAIHLFPENMAMAKVIGSYIFGICFGIVIFIRLMRKGKFSLSAHYWKFALKFNIPLIPHYLSDILLGGAGKLMIDRMVDRASAGIYAISNSIAGTLSIITGAINSTLIPETMKAVQSREHGRLRKMISIYAMIIAVCCAGIMLFGREVVLILASEKYLAAFDYVAPLVVTAYQGFLYGIIGNMLYYYEKTLVLSFTTITAAIANITLNFVGITLLGPVAVGYTTLITSLLKLIMVYCFASKVEKELSKFLDMKVLIGLWVILAASGAVSTLFQEQLLVRVAFVCIPLVFAFLKRRDILSVLKKHND
jgi:O-antigen/teichoic acid export membrane protein